MPRGTDHLSILKMTYFWHVTTPDWSKFASTQEQADALYQEAKTEGFTWNQITCTQHFEVKQNG